MRNLRNIHRSSLRSPDDLTFASTAWDVASDSVICAFGPTEGNDFIELKRWTKHSRELRAIASWDSPCPSPDSKSDKILNLHFSADSSTSCLVLAGGDLVVVRESPQDGEERIEIMGSVDEGISSAAWSPDEELLAIVTKASTLLYMTKDFENVIDLKMSDGDLSVSQHVSVGWGKQETQFKGRKARALRDPTVPESVDDGFVSELDDDRTTSITWRGDGAYLSVNSVVDTKKVLRRVVRVYSREGVLHSVSEPINGLEVGLSWRPAGNLIAGIQRLEGRLRVVFLERNGLRHGQFDIPISEKDAVTWGSNIALRWNIDSSVLAVCFLDRIQLWTMSNYQYSLKQELHIPTSSSVTAPTGITWHPEKPLHLLGFGQGEVQRLAFASVISGHSKTPPHDYGAIAVIDGKILRLTPLRVANVPPPMAVRTLHLPANIIDVDVSPGDTQRPSLQINVLHHGGVSIYDWPIKSLQRKDPKLRRMIDNPEMKASDAYVGSQISRVGKDHIALLYIGPDNSIIRFLKDAEFEQSQIPTRIEQPAYTIFSGDSEVCNRLLVMSEGSSYQNLSSRNEETISLLPGRICDVKLFPVDKARTEAFDWDDGSRIEDAKLQINGVESPQGNITFSLAENGSLYANQRVLVKNCTSFCVTPAHLVYTTSQHLLKIAHLKSGIEEIELPPDTPEQDERCRSIERGAKLVTVMPSNFAVVLQMPRGNIETVYPRALVLAGVRLSIEHKEYERAFFACRSQRVDLNILHDYAPEQLLANVGLFVDQLERVEHIDLFLSQLQEDDVTRTMYRETNSLPRPQAIPVAENETPFRIEKTADTKVNRVCKAFINVLEKRKDRVQNIISAFVCQQPPNLDEGLLRIAEMRAQDSKDVDLAIEHICFLADPNRLFDNALGLYDLELTLLIAQQSQKDPREYLPFLQNLQNLPDIRRKYSIDNHLGRYEKAFDSLCQLDSFEETKAYTAKHQMYNLALEKYRYQKEKLQDVLILYSEFLQVEGKFKDAALGYEYLHDYNNACDLYRRAHLWKESLSCAHMIPMNHGQVETLARNLASSLTESRDFSSAATIYQDYLSDIPSAISLFCRGYFFADAIRVATLHQRADLLTSTIDPALVESMSSMTEMIAEFGAQLNAQVPRLRELREKKTHDPLAFYDGEGGAGAGAGDVDIPDDVSLAATDASTAGGGSLFTRYTNRSSGTLATNATKRSSRNRRREERKKARGKKGSVYEEEYLVNSVRRLVERVNDVNPDVKRLVIGLFRRGMRERARAVENGMLEVVALCRSSVEEVFRALGGGEEKEKAVQSEAPESIGDDAAAEIGASDRGGMPLVKEFQKNLLLF